MKTKTLNTLDSLTAPVTSFGRACTGTCQKAMTQLQRVKSAILAEAQAALDAPRHLLRLVLNEAEAESWQTGFPHLVFPALATEKLRAVETWSQRQRTLRHRTHPLV